VYNLPHVSEVAALTIGEVDINKGDRDIIIEYKCGKLQRISELHPSYLALQYPLFFPYGEDGYTEDIQYRQGSIPIGRKRRTVSMREFFAYKIQMRDSDHSLILYGGKLLQQFIVDGYSSVERDRIDYILFNQNKIRAASYKGFHQERAAGATQSGSISTRIILPSTFIGGKRNLQENFQDAMTICHALGYPSLFITFTCNPKWPELVRLFSKFACHAEDRPDLVVRVFKIKLDRLIRDITKDKLFGKYLAGTL